MDLLLFICVDADMEDYGFEYSEEEQEEEDVDIENQYYNAKGAFSFEIFYFFVLTAFMYLEKFVRLWNLTCSCKIWSCLICL
jgi:hypothetical protein